jgi:hypothetical protein
MGNIGFRRSVLRNVAPELLRLNCMPILQYRSVSQNTFLPLLEPNHSSALLITKKIVFPKVFLFIGWGFFLVGRTCGKRFPAKLE